MVLVDLNFPLTQKETDFFPDLLQEPEKKYNDRLLHPPTEIQLNDSSSMSSVEVDDDEDDEDFLLDELLGGGFSVESNTDAEDKLLVVEPQEKDRRTMPSTDTLTTHSDGNDGDGFSEGTHSDYDAEESPVVVIHDFDDISADLTEEDEPSVVVLHHLEEPSHPSSGRLNNQRAEFSHGHLEVPKMTPSDNTSITQSDSSEERVIVETLSYENEVEGLVAPDYYSESDCEEAEDSSQESRESRETVTLLERAQDRIAMQHLHEEIAEQEEIICKKNVEIEQLSGQLRRAVATKCDLVIAHTELELHHENQLAYKDLDVDEVKKANRNLQETQSQVEIDLLNEIAKLTNDQSEARKAHQQELDDWERMHRNEMLEKDFEIAKLTEEMRESKKHDYGTPKKSGLKVMFRKQ
jgi:hypothetical protein